MPRRLSDLKDGTRRFHWTRREQIANAKQADKERQALLDRIARGELPAETLVPGESLAEIKPPLTVAERADP
ncbi:MAG: hypothetical protein LN413_05695 [Candidatus Thermoplasmatota archaeon]|nr:hypothetical protein [Candidatus Thermoplasmatota archaeon]